MASRKNSPRCKHCKHSARGGDTYAEAKHIRIKGSIEHPSTKCHVGNCRCDTPEVD